MCWCWSGPAARRQRWRWANRRRSGPAGTSLRAESGSTLCCLERNKEVRERLTFCTQTQREHFTIHLSSYCSQYLQLTFTDNRVEFREGNCETAESWESRGANSIDGIDSCLRRKKVKVNYLVYSRCQNVMSKN